MGGRGGSSHSSGGGGGGSAALTPEDLGLGPAEGSAATPRQIEYMKKMQEAANQYPLPRAWTASEAEDKNNRTSITVYTHLADQEKYDAGRAAYRKEKERLEKNGSLKPNIPMPESLRGMRRKVAIKTPEGAAYWAKQDAVDEANKPAMAQIHRAESRAQRGVWGRSVARQAREARAKEQALRTIDVSTLSKRQASAYIDEMKRYLH